MPRFLDCFPQCASCSRKMILVALDVSIQRYDQAMNIVLVEDDADHLNTYKQLLLAADDVARVDAFSSAAAAMRHLDAVSADILLTDLHMMGTSGIDLISRVKAQGRGIEIIALTADKTVETAIRAFKAGATGYILKTEAPEEMINTLREIVSGGFPMSPDIAHLLIQEYQYAPAGPQQLLSQRQMEILRDVEAGYPYKRIAERMSISVNTVHNHIRAIFDKLHASNKQEAINKAHEQGLL